MDRRAFLKATGLSLAAVTVESGLKFMGRIVSAKSPEPMWVSKAKKWAMAIDVNICDKKDGCRDCIEACHSVHNVPDFGNSKDEIKWIWTAPFGEVFPEQTQPFLKEGLNRKPVLVLCNHCDDPPCVAVCPVKATFKREDGVVMMDYHRCIGCRYCMAACPYGARSFNWRTPGPFIKNVNQGFPTRTIGVVEKCNFCEERLSKGLLPACVEACKDKAIRFGDLNVPDSEVRTLLKARFTIRRKPHLGTGPKIYYGV